MQSFNEYSSKNGYLIRCQYNCIIPQEFVWAFIVVKLLGLPGGIQKSGCMGFWTILSILIPGFLSLSHRQESTLLYPQLEMKHLRSSWYLTFRKHVSHSENQCLYESPTSVCVYQWFPSHSVSFLWNSYLSTHSTWKYTICGSLEKCLKPTELCLRLSENHYLLLKTLVGGEAVGELKICTRVRIQ